MKAAPKLLQFLSRRALAALPAPPTPSAPRRLVTPPAASSTPPPPSRSPRHQPLLSAGEEVPGEKWEKAVDYFRKSGILITVPDLGTGSDYNLITFNARQPYILKEAAKRSFRSLLQRVVNIHIANKCITLPIVMENILASSTGVLQFSEEETKAQTPEGVNRNYADLERCMVSIMKEIHGDDVHSKLPKGLSHLLSGMVDDSLDRSYLLPNHTSVLPASTRAIAVLKTYMLLFEELPKIDNTHATLASAILKTAAAPYMVTGNNWYDIAQNDAMLSRWLKHRGGRMYRRDEEFDDFASACYPPLHGALDSKPIWWHVYL
ncbi:uncharacterized protein C2845_PM05G32270 [Panicum miliaceum]|uniref:Uncharacterized protein n=1 Tax=Panicum miliaceum TaxID=4540 RepID=A0A3L6T3N4_PANMI|nr:uncharacterized protein C2845_PM05G32270 [Panicum miliaceum]